MTIWRTVGNRTFPAWRRMLRRADDDVNVTEFKKSDEKGYDTDELEHSNATLSDLIDQQQPVPSPVPFHLITISSSFSLTVITITIKLIIIK